MINKKTKKTYKNLYGGANIPKQKLSFTQKHPSLSAHVKLAGKKLSVLE